MDQKNAEQQLLLIQRRNSIQKKKRGIRQGDTISPKLFKAVLTTMLKSNENRKKTAKL